MSRSTNRGLAGPLATIANSGFRLSRAWLDPACEKADGSAHGFTGSP